MILIVNIVLFIAEWIFLTSFFKQKTNYLKLAGLQVLLINPLLFFALFFYGIQTNTYGEGMIPYFYIVSIGSFISTFFIALSIFKEKIKPLWIGMIVSNALILFFFLQFLYAIA